MSLGHRCKNLERGYFRDYTLKECHSRHQIQRRLPCTAQLLPVNAWCQPIMTVDVLVDGTATASRRTVTWDQLLGPVTRQRRGQLLYDKCGSQWRKWCRWTFQIFGFFQFFGGSRGTEVVELHRVVAPIDVELTLCNLSTDDGSFFLPACP